jgi:hypothetical protein
MPPIWSWARDRRIFPEGACVLHSLWWTAIYPNPARMRLAAYLGDQA